MKASPKTGDAFCFQYETIEMEFITSFGLSSFIGTLPGSLSGAEVIQARFISDFQKSNGMKNSS